MNLNLDVANCSLLDGPLNMSLQQLRSTVNPCVLQDIVLVL